MHNIKKYRLFSIFLFIFLIIILILLSLTIWNASIKEGYAMNKGLLFSCIAFILTLCIANFIISYRLSDAKKIDQTIIKAVDREKAKLIAEYKKQDKQEEEAKKDQADINKAVKKILQNTQNQKDLKSYIAKLFTNLAKELEIVQGLFYIKSKKSNQFSVAGEYAYTGEEKPKGFKIGDTLPGEAAKNKTIITIDDIPEDYTPAESGLGKSLPRHLTLVPVVNKGKPVAVLEIASFKSIDETVQKILKELSTNVGDKIDKFVS